MDRCVQVFLHFISLSCGAMAALVFLVALHSLVIFSNTKSPDLDFLVAVLEAVKVLGLSCFQCNGLTHEASSAVLWLHLWRERWQVLGSTELVQGRKLCNTLLQPELQGW